MKPKTRRLTLNAHGHPSLFSRVSRTAYVSHAVQPDKHLKLGLFGVFTAALLSACSGLPTASADASRLQQAAPPEPPKPIVALVLGGGGAKGFAHIGVIQALEAEGIRPDLVVGTSVGSVVGALYASGHSGAALAQLALTTPDSELTDFTLAYQGIIEGNKLRQFVNKQVNYQPIEDFPIRFAAVAAEKHSHKQAVFTQGEAGLMVQASSSVPNVFIAPRIPEQGGKKYVDGGVVSMVPVTVAKSLGADVVIAVDLQTGTSASTTPKSTPMPMPAPTQKVPPKNLWLLIEQGYQQTIGSLSNLNTASAATTGGQSGQSQQSGSYAARNRAEINLADVVIRPAVTDISVLDTTQRTKTIAAGLAAAQQRLPAIQAAITQAKAKTKNENQAGAAIRQ